MEEEPAKVAKRELLCGRKMGWRVGVDLIWDLSDKAKVERFKKDGSS